MNSLWHDQAISVGMYRAHSCKLCGALCVVGSAMNQHDVWHEKQRLLEELWRKSNREVYEQNLIAYQDELKHDIATRLKGA